uniref:Uncharacterized protein n=1 Tax=Rhipicephalus zambeziensis TaxID=60191 RepID=A0A224Y6T4_9ACAR
MYTVVLYEREHASAVPMLCGGCLQHHRPTAGESACAFGVVFWQRKQRVMASVQALLDTLPFWSCDWRCHQKWTCFLRLLVGGAVGSRHRVQACSLS